MNLRDTTGSLCVTAILALAPLSGCVSKPLPTYAPTDARASIATMQNRMAQIRTLSGRGELVLDDPTHGNVRFEAAYVMQPPDRARVRAWKLGQAVFDLTVVPEGVWLYSAEEPTATTPTSNQPNEAPSPLSDSLARTSEALPDWMAVLWGRAVPNDIVRERADAKATEVAPPMVMGDTLITTRSLAAGRVLRTVVARSTLTTTRADVIDPTGKSVFSLEMSDYHELEGVTWPLEIHAVSSSGRMTIITRTLSVNAAPESAFTPPFRARKLP